MARLPALPSMEIIRGFKGRIDFYLWKRLPCARAWPRYRQERTTPASKAAAATFGQILKNYSLMAPTVRAFFVQDAQDQPRTPRDLYVSAALGHLHRRTPIVTPPATFTVWSPDAPPATPSAFDDEFDDATFDTDLWTEFDPGGFLTISENETGLILDVATDPATDLCGVYQATPPFDFTITAKIHLTAVASDNSQFGLGLWNDAANPAAGLYHWRLRCSQADQGIQLVRFTNWTTWHSNIYTDSDDVIGTHLYLRIRRIGANYYFSWSSDGIAWRRCHAGALAFTPNHFGILINNGGALGIIRGIATFFRYIDSGLFHAILQGDRILETRNA